MKTDNLKKQFNPQSIPQLDTDAQRVVERSQLVMIFDKGTATETVVKTLLAAQEKTKNF